MLDLLKLKTFQAAAATNNFTRAAAELGYSQSKVTTHIQALESELGAPLFDRVGRNVILTEVGRRTLEYANRLIDQLSSRPHDFTYEDFKPRTIWSLSKKFTSAFKELDPIPQFTVTAKLGDFLEAPGSLDGKHELRNSRCPIDVP